MTTRVIWRTRAASPLESNRLTVALFANHVWIFGLAGGNTGLPLAL